MSEQRYCVVSDGDGHSWLCPAQRRAEAVELIEACETYWATFTTGLGAGPTPPDPDSVGWLRRIESAEHLTFTDPREDA